jgi:guanidinoacetate N-methyltransferase
MLRKLKRLRDFELSLQISNDQFIRPPREGQRNWLINKAMNEFVADLTELDKLAKRFVPGADNAIHITDRSQSVLSDEEIMENWQIPLMQAMAAVVTEQAGDVLEVGFGRGISADYIQKGKVRSHTIVECNDTIVERFHQWKKITQIMLSIYCMENGKI